MGGWVTLAWSWEHYNCQPGRINLNILISNLGHVSCHVRVSEEFLFLSTLSVWTFELVVCAA